LCKRIQSRGARCITFGIALDNFCLENFRDLIVCKTAQAIARRS
jgi:hypothetical protein